MANLILDDLGRPVPQFLNQSTGLYEAATGSGGAMNVRFGSGALPAGTNTIGKVLLDPLPAGTNNIGDVDIASMPPLPAGTNNIGDVDIVSMPPLPAGTNNIGKVIVTEMPAISVGPSTPVGNSCLKAVLSPNEPLTVKNGPGIVYMIKANVADVKLIDNYILLWDEIQKEVFEGGIACADNIILMSATGGTAYILYK